jgi:hypothetical protein
MMHGQKNIKRRKGKTERTVLYKNVSEDPETSATLNGSYRSPKDDADLGLFFHRLSIHFHHIVEFESSRVGQHLKLLLY